VSELNSFSSLLEFSPSFTGFLRFGTTAGLLVGGVLAALLPSKRVTTTIQTINWGVVAVAITCFWTDNSLVKLLCTFLISMSVFLLNQIVGQRLFANLHNKTLATAVPSLVTAVLSIVGGSRFVAIGNTYGFDIAYACALPLGVLARVSFHWLKSLLTDKTTK
jgi:hypothetical protein